MANNFDIMFGMNIHVIFTGGTISGVIEGDSIRPGGDLEGRLELCDKNELHFTFEEPYRILSEDLKASHVLKLKDSVAMAADHSDGIIITHGTDTLHYTAALLHYMFAGIGIPVILVSSAYVLSDPRSNGRVNFEAAVEYIRRKGTPGVYISYKNPSFKGEAQIIRGDRLLSSMAGSSDFFEYFATDKREGTEPCKGRECAFDENDERSETDKKEKCAPGEDSDFRSGDAELEELIYDGELLSDLPAENIKLCEKSDMILRLAAYPGMCFNNDLVTDRTRVVMLEGYHSGTIGVTDELRVFVKYCKERRIPVLLSFLNSGECEYETVDTYRKAGVIPVYDVPPVALYCKLWLIFSNFTES